MSSPKLSPKHQIYILNHQLYLPTHGLLTLNMSPNQDLNTCSTFWFIQLVIKYDSLTSEMSLDSVPFPPSLGPMTGARFHFHLLSPGLYPFNPPSFHFQNYSPKTHASKSHVYWLPGAPLCLQDYPPAWLISPFTLWLLPGPVASPASTPLFLTSHSTAPSLYAALCLIQPMILGSKALAPTVTSPDKFLLILLDLLDVTPSLQTTPTLEARMAALSFRHSENFEHTLLYSIITSWCVSYPKLWNKTKCKLLMLIYKWNKYKTENNNKKSN